MLTHLLEIWSEIINDDKITSMKRIFYYHLCREFHLKYIYIYIEKYHAIKSFEKDFAYFNIDFWFAIFSISSNLGVSRTRLVDTSLLFEREERGVFQNVQKEREKDWQKVKNSRSLFSRCFFPRTHRLSFHLGFFQPTLLPQIWRSDRLLLENHTSEIHANQRLLFFLKYWKIFKNKIRE